MDRDELERFGNRVRRRGGAVLSRLRDAAAEKGGDGGEQLGEVFAQVDWRRVAKVGIPLFVGLLILAWLFVSGLILWAIVLAVAFGFGAGFIPALVYIFGPVLPGTVQETVASLLLTVAMLGIRWPVLKWTETGEYVIERGKADLGPPSFWSRFAMAPFGVSYVRSADTFGDAAVSGDKLGLKDRVSDKRFAGNKDTVDIERAGHPSFVDLDDDPDSIFVPIGETLSRLRDSAGIDIINRQEAESLKDQAKNLGNYSPNTMLVGGFLMALMGAALGWVVFF